jgi:hypothetical protein
VLLLELEEEALLADWALVTELQETTELACEQTLMQSLLSILLDSGVLIFLAVVGGILDLIVLSISCSVALK